MRKGSKLKSLETMISNTPTVFEGDPLLLAELDDIKIEKDIKDYIHRVDALDQIPSDRTVILGPITNYYDRWPVIEVSNKVPEDISRFNQSLFMNFDSVNNFAFSQSDIAAKIEEDLNVDLVVLLLIDGLSYADWKDFPNVQSCLVDAPSITETGFLNVIGKPTIAQRLFDRGFKKRLGFSYWDRDNELTDKLFYGFDPANQMYKVNEFEEIILELNRLPKEQTFIQIIVNGLDAISHRYRGRPPVNLLARDIYESILLALIEHLHKVNVSALVYVTADHGILWKPNLETENEMVVIRDKRIHSRRYVKGTMISPHSKQFVCNGITYSSLAYPYLFNPLSNLEWGTHGGISFQESVVPFVKMEVL